MTKYDIDIVFWDPHRYDYQYHTTLGVGLSKVVCDWYVDFYGPRLDFGHKLKITTAGEYIF